MGEVKKSPQLLNEEVPDDAAAWSFLLRVASEKPTFSKQVWEAAAVLVENRSWTTSFAAMDDKHRLNITRATARDAPLVSGLILRLVEVGAAEMKDLLPLANI